MCQQPQDRQLGRRERVGGGRRSAGLELVPQRRRERWQRTRVAGPVEQLLGVCQRFLGDEAAATEQLDSGELEQRPRLPDAVGDRRLHRLLGGALGPGQAALQCRGERIREQRRRCRGQALKTDSARLLERSVGVPACGVAPAGARVDDRQHR